MLALKFKHRAFPYSKYLSWINKSWESCRLEKKITAMGMIMPLFLTSICLFLKGRIWDRYMEKYIWLLGFKVTIYDIWVIFICSLLVEKVWFVWKCALPHQETFRTIDITVWLCCMLRYWSLKHKPGNGHTLWTHTGNTDVCVCVRVYIRVHQTPLETWLKNWI